MRIEDTDQKRYVEGAVDVIYNTLKLAGIQHDEGPDIGGDYGPYIQSQRKDIYVKYAKKLVEKGKAYYCFCPKGSQEDQDSRDDQDVRNGLDDQDIQGGPVVRDVRDGQYSQDSQDSPDSRDSRNKRLVLAFLSDPDEAARRIESGQPYVIRKRCRGQELQAFMTRFMVRLRWKTVNWRIRSYKIRFLPTYNLQMLLMTIL